MMAALERCGWTVLAPLGRGDDLVDAAADADLIIVATPDATVGEVGRSFSSGDHQVVCHLAGSLGIDVLSSHARPASVHPLMSLSDAQSGADLLQSGGWFAVAGDPLAHKVVDDLGGRTVTVPDSQRVTYHAAAAIASNHAVALLGQVERLAASVGVPLEAYLDLARGSLDNVAAVGPAAALTGPAARGDTATLERHRAALREHHPRELASYDAMVDLAVRLVEDGPAGGADGAHTRAHEADPEEADQQ
jgi:predicted short-subunit dehydrogenase-like oxidoreductase (DUF2520 family)